MDLSGVKPIGAEPAVEVNVDRIPQYVVDFAKGRGKDSDVGIWIRSLLPEEEKPWTLREKLEWNINDMVDTSFGDTPLTSQALAAEVLKIVAADIKEKFGWETRITSYLRDQAK